MNAGCGQNFPASFAYLDLDTFFWRTSQACYLSGLDEFFETWPRSGTMLNGFAFQLGRLVPHISANGYLLWDGLPGMLPTMTASLAEKKGADYARKFRAGGCRGPDLQTYAILFPFKENSQIKQSTKVTGGLLNPTWCEWYQGFPEGWTELEDLETVLSHKLPSGSAGE